MVPQVLQLNEMQPCWEERLPHCPRYPPNTHTLKPGLFSSYPHAVPAPTLLMFIHQPLTGQTQRPVKTKSDLFIYDARSSPLYVKGALRHPGSHVWCLPSFGQALTTHVTPTTKNTNCTGTAGRDPEATEKVRWKNLRRQRGMKRGRDRQRMRPHFHCWWLTACHPGSIMIFDWQVSGKERVGNRVQDKSLKWEQHNITPMQGVAQTLINDKEHTRISMFSLHASDVVCRLRLVFNLLYVLMWNVQSTTWEVVSEHLAWASWLFVFSPLF